MNTSLKFRLVRRSENVIVPEHSTENHTVTQAVPYLQLQTSIYGGRWKDVPIVEPEDEEAS